MYSSQLLLLLPAVLGLAVPRAGKALTADERIIGGFASGSSEHPYAVSLNITTSLGSGLCGGTLLTDQVIVTAAHCAIDLDLGTPLSASSVRVGLGSQKLSQQRFVQALEVHANPKFQPPELVGDIALIIIAPVKFGPHLQPATVYAGHIPEGTRLTAVGWGMTRTDGSGFGRVPNALRETELIVGTRGDCSEFVPGYESSDGPQICTENKLLLGRDTCQGDSGTGVFITVDGHKYLAGLTSYGANLAGDPTCALDDGFGVYTRISYFRSFIDSFAAALGNKRVTQNMLNKAEDIEDDEDDEDDNED
ncbi:serine-type endopeptidase activity protein [Coemansia sp. RSA 2681]|nr:serine-type endopeptidase activity protein [Coemansia sp. RSA 2681]